MYWFIQVHTITYHYMQQTHFEGLCQCLLLEEIDLKIFLHNSDFNADDVDKDMLEQFASFIGSGDSKIISMHQEGDGAQKLELFKRRF